jgi:NADPH-dependent ferric siderophore reductase
MPFLDTLMSAVLKKGNITYRSRLSGHVYHLRISSESFQNYPWHPGHFLRLLCGFGKDMPIRDKIRSYSVWNFNSREGYIDILACAHSDGPGASWVKTCQVGDEIYFKWETGKFILDDGPEAYLFVGDLSALGHLYGIRRHLKQGKKIHSFIYGADTHDFVADIDGSKPFDFYQLTENVMPSLIKLISPIQNDFSNSKLAYIGGDGQVCSALFKYLKNEQHWATRELKAKPFWTLGKTGLD